MLAVEIDSRDTAAHMARVLDRDLVACGGVRAAAPPVAESEARPVLRQARIDLQPLAVQVEWLASAQLGPFRTSRGDCLGMELQCQGMRANAEGLIRRDVRGRQQRGLCRHIERIGVPMQDLNTHQVAQARREAGRAQGEPSPADLLLFIDVNRAAQHHHQIDVLPVACAEGLDAGLAVLDGKAASLEFAVALSKPPRCSKIKWRSTMRRLGLRSSLDIRHFTMQASPLQPAAGTPSAGTPVALTA